jgi:hypothetical protein
MSVARSTDFVEQPRGGETPPRPAVAPAEEDPNAEPIACSSPPCFLHELDPAWLGYLGRDEVLALLRALLEVRCGSTRVEEAWRRAMLRRHIAHLDPQARHLAAVGAPGAAVAPDDDRPGGAQERPDRRVEALAARLREALPRVADDALRSDLAQVLGMLERYRGRWRPGPGLAATG